MDYLLKNFNCIFHKIKQGYEKGKIHQGHYEFYINNVKEIIKRILEIQTEEHTEEEKRSNIIGLEDIDIGILDKCKDLTPKEKIEKLKQKMRNLKIIAEQMTNSIYSCSISGTNILMAHSINPLENIPQPASVPEELENENSSLNTYFQIIPALELELDEKIKKLNGCESAEFKKRPNDPICIIQ